MKFNKKELQKGLNQKKSGNKVIVVGATIT